MQELDTALKRVRTSHVARRARSTPWFREAQCLRTNQAVEALCEELPDRVNTTSLLGLTEGPLKRQLLALLRAAFCVLGEDEDTVRVTAYSFCVYSSGGGRLSPYDDGVERWRHCPGHISFLCVCMFVSGGGGRRGETTRTRMRLVRKQLQ